MHVCENCQHLVSGELSAFHGKERCCNFSLSDTDTSTKDVFITKLLVIHVNVSFAKEK